MPLENSKNSVNSIHIPKSCLVFELFIVKQRMMANVCKVTCHIVSVITIQNHCVLNFIVTANVAIDNIRNWWHDFASQPIVQNHVGF